METIRRKVQKKIEQSMVRNEASLIFFFWGGGGLVLEQYSAK